MRRHGELAEAAVVLLQPADGLAIDVGPVQRRPGCHRLQRTEDPAAAAAEVEDPAEIRHGPARRGYRRVDVGDGIEPAVEEAGDVAPAHPHLQVLRRRRRQIVLAHHVLDLRDQRRQVRVFGAQLHELAGERRKLGLHAGDRLGRRRHRSGHARSVAGDFVDLRFQDALGVDQGPGLLRDRIARRIAGRVSDLLVQRVAYALRDQVAQGVTHRMAPGAEAGAGRGLKRKDQ